ncbi:MAG: oligosaccharide flippase family protein [Anaerolineae bacterium]|jgi:O-antigen/teichoic acid export membrane protein|nr:oligosaccharide flippase family protein [Anaerolineae bacterium]
MSAYSGSAGKPKRLSLRRNFSWTFIGNTVYAASQWGLLVILARLGSPEVVGQFSLALALTAPVILFANLQLRGVQATDARHEYTPRMYLALRLLTTLLGWLVIVFIALSGGYAQETMLVIGIVGLAKAAEAISDVLYGYLQQHERMEFIARSMMIKGIGSLLAMGIAVFFTGSMVWGSVALAVVWALLLLFYDIPAVRRVARETAADPADPEVRRIMQPAWQWDRLWRLAWLSLPLGFVMMLISLNTNIPRYYMQEYYGERELGIFSALSYWIVVITTIVQALAQSATPRLSKYYVNQEARAFISLLAKLLGLGVVLAVAGVLVAWIGGRELLLLVFGPEYAGRSQLFVLVMIAGGMKEIASFAGYAMTAVRYFRSQTVLFIIITIATYVGCVLWVPEHGSNGAVMALLLAGVIQLVGSLAVTAYAILRIKEAAAAQPAGEQGLA